MELKDWVGVWGPVTGTVALVRGLVREHLGCDKHPADV